MINQSLTRKIKIEKDEKIRIAAIALGKAEAEQKILDDIEKEKKKFEEARIEKLKIEKAE